MSYYFDQDHILPFFIVIAAGVAFAQRYRAAEELLQEQERSEEARYEQQQEREAVNRLQSEGRYVNSTFPNAPYTAQEDQERVFQNRGNQLMNNNFFRPESLQDRPRRTKRRGG